MTMQEIEAGLVSAKATISNVESQVAPMVRMCANLLRRAGGNWQTTEALRAMKRELRDFDSRTGTWK